LRRDFVFSSSDHTFNVDLPNGKYQVTLVIGDQNYMHDKINVYGEAGLMVNDLTVPSGTFKEVTFTVTVSDGQLNITLHDNGGADPNWVINSMTVESYL
jgi:fibronectin type 3 domain-containing protein